MSGRDPAEPRIRVNTDPRHPGSETSRIRDIPDPSHPESEASRIRVIPDPSQSGSESSRIRDIPDPRHPGSESSRIRVIRIRVNPGSCDRSESSRIRPRVPCDEGIKLSELRRHANSPLTRMFLPQSRWQSRDVLEFLVTNPFLYKRNKYQNGKRRHVSNGGASLLSA
jgi:hypothetical protein